MCVCQASQTSHISKQNSHIWLQKTFNIATSYQQLAHKTTANLRVAGIEELLLSSDFNNMG